MTDLAQSASALVSFSFDQSFNIRIVMRDGDPWFVAADVCAALGIANNRDALDKLDDDEKGVALTDTLGGQQEVGIVNESGLYTLVLRCRQATKPGTVPHRFRKWVTNEVLPSIRKTGAYQIAPAPEVYERISPEQLQQLSAAMTRAFGGWVFSSSQSSIQHGYNRLRVDHSIAHIADLPAAEFEQALARVREFEAMVDAFLSFMCEAKHEFLTLYIEGGAPWTLWLTRQWKKQMQTALPPRPDWLALHRQLNLPLASQEASS